ncbi:MAG: methyltransferase domain-containing protein [Candidatus Lernaella stagnicola]|nr:methyltransferase domain-containing protein [Candidatus Lernaella stagnicola]
MKGARRRLRIGYYNAFSRVYDSFIQMHSSGDSRTSLRDELAASVGVGQGDKVLDLCTGTGAMLPPLSRRVGKDGQVVGVDFSPGMLQRAHDRVADTVNVELCRADVTNLPFEDNTFDGATISHAFYELNGEDIERFLREVHRVLKPGGHFVMMEHEVPTRAVIRMLYYLRILSMGSAKTLGILRHEQEQFESIFQHVEKRLASSGESKIYICTKRDAD